MKPLSWLLPSFHALCFDQARAFLEDGGGSNFICMEASPDSMEVRRAMRSVLEGMEESRARTVLAAKRKLWVVLVWKSCVCAVLLCGLPCRLGW